MLGFSRTQALLVMGHDEIHDPQEESIQQNLQSSRRRLSVAFKKNNMAPVGLAGFGVEGDENHSSAAWGMQRLCTFFKLIYMLVNHVTSFPSILWTGSGQSEKQA